MAKDRVFTIKINGVDKSYKDVVSLNKALDDLEEKSQKKITLKIDGIERAFMDVDDLKKSIKEMGDTKNKVFTIKIDGIEKSFQDVAKLVSALEKLQTINVNIAQTVEKAEKAIKAQNKAVTEEEKAQRKLNETQDKATRVITETERLQAQANVSLRERTRALQLQAEAENTATNSIESMKIKLKQLREEFKHMDVDSDVFEKTKKEIEELDAKIKELSPTTNGLTKQLNEISSNLEERFDSLNDGISQVAENSQGMLNLLQAGIGTVLMFDESNEELNEVLADVGKIMAIVGALQAANNTLLKNGAIASKTAALMEGIHAAQVRARAISISLATKNTLLATVAQKAFNIAASANPYVLLAIALITVVGALAAFALGTEDSTKKQKEHNEVIKESIALKEQYLSVVKQLSDSNIAQLQRELDLLKARGVSDAQIALKQRQIYEERIKYAKKNAIQYEKDIKNIEKNKELVTKYTLEIAKNHEKLKAGIYKNNDAYKEQKERLQENLDIATKFLNNGLQAQEELRQTTADLENFNAEQAKKGAELGKKNALALSEYKVLIAKKGSKEELEARILAANQQLKNDLSATDITNGERLKRTRETLLQIQSLESEYRKQQHQEEMNLIDAQLETVKIGSSAEYSLKVDSLRVQKKIDLENTELTASEKLKIENKYNNDLSKLSKEYTDRIVQEGIQAEISAINARLAYANAGSKEEFEIRKELLKKNAELAKEQNEATINNEELKAEKIKEINATLQKDLKDLSVEEGVSGIKKIQEQETADLLTQLEKRKLNRRRYEEEILKISFNSLKDEIELRKANGEDTIELENELAEMRIQIRENEKNKTINHWKELSDKLQEYADRVMTGVTAVFDATNTILQSQLDAANEKYDAITKKYDEVVAKREESDSRLQELEEQSKTATGGRFIILQQQITDQMQANRQLAEQEKQLAKEKEKSEKEIAKKERQQKKVQLVSDIATATANTALGFTRALEWGFPLGPIFAAIIGASGALQVMTMTKQLAKLEDGGLLNGKRHANGGMRVEGTNIEVEGGEYVINRTSTSKNIDLIKYINSQRRELGPSDMSAFFSKTAKGFEPPFRRMFEEGGQLPVFTNNSNIDNEILIDAIKGMKIESSVSVVDINNAQKESVKVDNWTGV
ncbi:hypothetical protein E2605_18050 [Dysgonomonas capnocytophagoides]|uniref:Uncharacterized protein n=1 Tax=Dysgonomonas capnocytophagoides TaxID=45254 RepID=A0A4Y8KUH9_9BACT|nr:hypothetical protein [Dysgonomonas capnocytophagoides]TFD93015.1 hypothetical protein E2605_18050 [Dysgonomonas capnocytophagoides]